MKTLLKLIVVSFVLLSANQSYGTEWEMITKKEYQEVESLILKDGRTLWPTKDVFNAGFYKNNLDYLILNDGEVVDRTDLQLNEKGFLLGLKILMKRGVDGGG